MNTEKKNLIKTIYLYFLTGVGLVMFLFGSYQMVQHVTKKVFLPKYYLDYQESRCDYLSYPATPDGKGGSEEEKSRIEKERERCNQKLEEERKYQEVLNLSRSISLIILGAITFLFHYKNTQKA